MYKLTLNDLKIKKETLSDIFTFEETRCTGLNRESYANIIGDEILTQLKSSVNIQWGRDNGASIIIYLYCPLKTCDYKVKLNQKKSNIKCNEDVSFAVKTNREKCQHREKVGRPLKGLERKKVAQEAKNTSITQVRDSAIIKSDKELLYEGNLQKIYTKPVIKQAISELNKKNDKSCDPVNDLFLQINDLSCVYSMEIKKERFSITLISEKQIEILKSYATRCHKNEIVSRIHYDATGGILASPSSDIRNLFHHIIVIPLKFNENDKCGTFVNVGELISALHTSEQQEIYLRRFIHLASKQIKQQCEL